MTMSSQSPAGPAPVVVGVDGSGESWRAIHAAAWEARVRQAPLVLAHGYPADPYTWYGWAPMYVGPAYDPREAATAMVEETANEVRTAHPDLDVSIDVQIGTGAHALIQASADASMVVVGSRGRGGFAGLSIGSTAAQTAAHAGGAVLVVRPIDGEPVSDTDTQPPAVFPRPVLVGVDGSSTSESAIAFAFEEAALRRVPLLAVYVWWLLPTHTLGPDLPRPDGFDAAREEAHRMLAELMSGWAAKYPDVSLQLRPVQGMNPSHELVEASRDAGLVVVGSRGRGGFAGLLLGSVSRDLVGHAHCPVAVVHPSISR
jgi:nucleotide-binding universal stress UspA family protein